MEDRIYWTHEDYHDERMNEIYEEYIGDDNTPKFDEMIADIGDLLTKICKNISDEDYPEHYYTIERNTRELLDYYDTEKSKGNPLKQIREIIINNYSLCRDTKQPKH